EEPGADRAESAEDVGNGGVGADGEVEQSRHDDEEGKEDGVFAPQERHGALLDQLGQLLHGRAARGLALQREVDGECEYQAEYTGGGGVGRELVHNSSVIG